MIEIVAQKSQFKTGDPLLFECNGARQSSGKVNVFSGNQLFWLKEVEIVENSFELAAHFPPGGYLLELEIDQQTVQTAFDVDSKAIRYGFLSDFFEGGENDEAAIKWLRKLHLNFLQYYDWMYRHDNFIPEEDRFQDLLGRNLSLSTIKSRIRQAHASGMYNLAYGAIYGATNQLAAAHPDWRMYDKDGRAITFFDFLSIMNVNSSRPWHDHILAEYKKAVQLGFDGIHMDTYGFPKNAHDFENKKLDLPADFGQLIDDAREELEKVKDDVKLIFNNVGNWPVPAVANRKQDALYIEVWEPYDSYQSLEEIIRKAKSCSLEKPVILAAYLKIFEQDVTEETYNALWLLTAVITVLGATHLIHGENAGLITEGYYADYFRINDEEMKQKISVYYDYITYLASFWNDASLEDVSRTHFLGDNREYVSDNKLLSPNLIAGKVWVNIRQNSSCKFINFVNLSRVENTKWNEKKEISEVGPYQFRVLLDDEVEEVTYSTPDGDGRKITIKQLDYSFEKSQFGEYLVVNLPALEVWGSLLIKNRNERK
ncbi:glycoside hydrolase family 66 protein [Lactovum odontotermitis]